MNKDLFTTSLAVTERTVNVCTEDGILVASDYPTKTLVFRNRFARGHLGYNGDFPCEAINLPSSSAVAIDIVLKWLTKLYESKESIQVPKPLLDVENHLPDGLDMANKVYVLALIDDLKFERLLQCQVMLVKEIKDHARGLAGPLDMTTLKAILDLFKYHDRILTHNAISTFIHHVNTSDDKLDVNNLLEPIHQHHSSVHKQIAGWLMTKAAAVRTLKPYSNEDMEVEDKVKEQVDVPESQEWEDLSLDEEMEVDKWGVIHRGKMVVVEEVDVEVVDGGDESDDGFEMI